MSKAFDVAVIGAGPAGAFSACLLAREGHRVLLLERSTWPRFKVCGCCLSELAVGLLDSLVGELNIAEALLQRADLRIGKRNVEIALRKGAVTERSELDAALVRRAQAQGVEFHNDTKVTNVRDEDGSSLIESSSGTWCARVVVHASGNAALPLPRTHPLQARECQGTPQLIGASALLPNASLPDIPIGSVRMLWADAGYLGLVRLADGRVNAALALEPRALESNTIAAAAAVIAGCYGSSLPDAEWKSVPRLRYRRSCLGYRNHFLLGDSAGYSEPFTGEGIGWALASARESVEFISEALGGDVDASAAWDQHWRVRLGELQRFSRGLTAALRAPLSRALLSGITKAPSARTTITALHHTMMRRQLHRSFA